MSCPNISQTVSSSIVFAQVVPALAFPISNRPGHKPLSHREPCSESSATNFVEANGAAAGDAHLDFHSLSHPLPHTSGIQGRGREGCSRQVMLPESPSLMNRREQQKL
jgi:hypothetical protein